MKNNPYLNRKQNKKKVGHKAEQLTAQRLGAKQHPGSGSKSVKADMTLGAFKIENKATTKDSYRLTLETLLKLSQEALEVGANPMLAIQFTDGTGKPCRNGNWIMLKEDYFKDLIAHYEREII